MRIFLAGLLLLILPASVFAEPSGQVQSIGFNGSYRPNCWTPMLIRLVPDTTDSVNYQIQVFQHDLDGDKPVYTRNIVLNGSGQATDQTFWTYFLPQPIDKGLTDGNLHQLQKDLEVFLYSADGRRPITKLPLTSTLQNVDPNFTGNSTGKPQPPAKLILTVSSNGAKQPEFGRYNDAIGSLHDIEPVSLRMRDLPDDPLGYEAVDAVVWVDGNLDDLAAGNQDAVTALKDYVRFGGHLVVCNPTSNFDQTRSLGEMLPVELLRVETKSDFEPLKSLAASTIPDPFQPPQESWGHAAGPFQMVRAKARPGSVVDTWIDWKQDGSNTDVSPYIARKAFGLGQVTWVAQPLTTDSAPSNPAGWPHVWDRVFGWNDRSIVLPNQPPDDPNLKYDYDRLVSIYKAAGPVDLGFSMVQGLNLGSKSASLIFLAVVFFLIYWVVAGPGTYAYLVAKKRQGLSWLFFGVSAIVATLVTTLVVRLVLRGPPQISHVSFVLSNPGQPAIVYSRFGLYIPRDGDQTIELKETSPTSVSYVSPFAEHPQQLGDVAEAPSPADYTVPVRDIKSETSPAITVPYRSSLKKFEARWVGDTTMKFIGSPTLDPDDRRIPIAGALTNATGQDLYDVYLAFKIDNERNWMIYIPNWPKGTTYDLKKDLGKPLFVGKTESSLTSRPGQGKVLSDEIAPATATTGWKSLWFDHFRRNSEIDDPDKDENFSETFPVLSVLDCLPAMANTLNLNNVYTEDRVELLARGARMLDATPRITAGQLVVLGSSKGPLPIPVDIDGDRISGDGTTFYQFSVPLDRGKADEPATQPMTDKK